MMKFFRFHGSWLSIVAMAALTFPMACLDDDSTSPEVVEVPEIPSQSTMLIDFSNFASASFAPSSGNELLEPLTTQNWGWAALNAVLWQTVITVGLAIPVASFVESFNHEPELQEDGWWLWSYSVTVGSNVYKPGLKGRFGGMGTQWEMYVSKAGEYTDFLWYKGEADLVLTEGWWLMYESPEVPEELLDIQWHRDLETETADIRYTNVKPGGPENGGYIFYGSTTGAMYDAFYDIYDIGDDNHTNAEWRRTSQNGRVRDPRHFGDNEWYCWDENLDDTVCP